MYYDALRIFVTLAEVKNFTKTAEQLHISQPSVSLHIKNLEQEFQTKLFLRSPKYLQITPTGKMLYSRAKQILTIYEQTKEEILEHHHDIKGKLTVGASFSIGEYILPALLVDLQSNYPNLDLEIIIRNTDEIVQLVRLFKADIGLIEGQSNEKELIIRPFMEDELFVVSSPEHKLANKEMATISDLQHQTWLIREAGSGTHRYLEHVIRSNGLNVQSLISISSNQGIKEAIISGVNGLSLLSYYVIGRDVRQNNLSIIPLKNHAFKRTLSYVYSPIMESKKNVAAFLQALHRKWA